ncbi:MAG: 16S rRNA (adenine(1518)-N(6)/adenine(1519)-N(6))-dimethyltransferase RsmA [Acidimicrobiales bacterium]
MTHGRGDIREILVANDLRPRRSLGQNFVADANTVRRIVRLSGVAPGDHVIEVGAGLGSLTLALAETGAEVVAVEVDPAVLPVLREQVEPQGVRVVEGDARTLDWDELLQEASSWSMVANLPYNVAVPLVVRVLEEAPRIVSLLVMVQREVGERLAARSGEDAYGAVSVKVAYWATAKVVARVPPSVFVPRPKVESVVVRLVRHGAEGGRDGASRSPAGPGNPAYDRLFSVVRAGFAHRRKMLRRSLEGVVEPAAFTAAGIAPTARAEEVSLEGWERLAGWEPGEPGEPGEPWEPGEPGEPGGPGEPGEA